MSDTFQSVSCGIISASCLHPRCALPCPWIVTDGLFSRGRTYRKFSVFAMIKLWLDILNPNLVSFLKLVIVDPCDTAFEKKFFVLVFNSNGHFRQKKTGNFNFHIDSHIADTSFN